VAYPLAPSTSRSTGPANRADNDSVVSVGPEGVSIEVDKLLASLEKEAERRVRQRQPIEQRWIRESYQYHGRYLESEEQDIKSSSNLHRSTVYMNETRRKADAMEDRIIDIQFPVDDRNFSIGPTSVPELSDEAMAWARFAAENQQMLLQIPDGAPEAQEAIEAQREALSRATETQSIMDEARRRADAMQSEMDDQLQECMYNYECKLMTHDACKLGTGIMKGPVLSTERKRIWRKKTDKQSGFTVHEMVEVEEPRPAFYRVDPWNWFPDMDVSRLSESEKFFERHLLTSSGLKRLATIPGFIKENIRKLIKEKARGTAPTYISELRGITDEGNYDAMKDRYHVWEYYGPIDQEDMGYIADYTDNEGLRKYAGEVDPLEEINVTVWFCQGVLLKFGIHPLDSGEHLYSVFNYKKDDHSIFGFGVPHLMAHQQKVLCGAWRMMVDNAGIATAPQIVYNPSIVEPADGDHKIYPGKEWLKKSGVAPGERVFETYHIDIRQAEMERIVEMTLQAIDREIGVPTIAEADPGTVPMQTALGISVFSSEKKVPFKALIQHFDDNVTIPNMRRLFNFNMQFSKKEHIKGDAKIRARGTSTFMLRELQAPAIMTMLLQFANHPVLGPALKIMPMVRLVAQAMLLSQHEVVKSDEQMAADLAAAAQNQPEEPSPEEIKLQIAQLQAESASQQAQINAESDRYVIDRQIEIEQLRRQTALDKIAADNDTKKTIKDREIEHKDRAIAVDVGMAERYGKGTGGLV
jgi:hypothetical protein